MKKEKLFVLIFGLILFSSIVSAATDGCSIKSSCSSNEFPILGLYSTTNSHGYLVSGNNGPTGSIIGFAVKLFDFMKSSSPGPSNTQSTGNYFLCCNFNPGSKTCTNSDVVLKLSSATNAHAEISTGNHYTTNVCYYNLQCIGTNSLTPTLIASYPIKMLSLSSDTNAHISNYDDTAYAWKILCKTTGSTQNSVLTNAASSWSSSTLNLDSSKLGTDAAKVQITTSNMDKNSGTLSVDIYARHLVYTAGGTSGIKGVTPTKQSGASGNIIRMLGNAITFNFKSSSTETSKLSGTTETSYTYSPIRTITATINSGSATANWIINQTDIDNAGVSSNGIYEFTYKLSVGADSKTFYNRILTVNMFVNNSQINPTQTWLDGNKATIITSKTMNWNLLISPSTSGSGTGVGLGGGGAVKNNVITGGVIGITGNAVGGAIPPYSTNLVYINASLPALANQQVNFWIYESNAGEGLTTNDSIRIGSAAISVKADSNGNAVAPWYVLQSDINNALPGDSFDSNGVGNFEFYYKVKSGTNSYAVNNYLNLQITNYPVNNSVKYLANSQGMWANKDFTVGITKFDYNSNADNTVGLVVGDIDPAAVGKTTYFHIYAINGSGNSFVPIVNDNSLSAVVDGNNESYVTWTIHSGDLQVTANNATNYKFYFEIILGNENKVFNQTILDVNTQESGSGGGGGGGGGGGDQCDDIYYCSDYSSKSKCESDICEVISNENVLNPSLNCLISNCYCYWSNSGCHFGYSNSSFVSLGTCSYTKGEVQDNCANAGVLITPYTASWAWASGNCYSTQALCSAKLSSGETCINSDACWRIKDSTYDNCKDYQESVECSPTGGGLGGGGGIINTKLNWLWIILVIGIVVVGFCVYLVARKIMKEKMIKKLFKTRENFNNILDYIKKARQQKMPDNAIRKSLAGAGWNYDQIEFAFKHAPRVRVK